MIYIYIPNINLLQPHDLTELKAATDAKQKNQTDYQIDSTLKVPLGCSDSKSSLIIDFDTNMLTLKAVVYIYVALL